MNVYNNIYLQILGWDGYIETHIHCLIQIEKFKINFERAMLVRPVKIKLNAHCDCHEASCIGHRKANTTMRRDNPQSTRRYLAHHVE
jgi:hypothetical protein